MKALTLLGLLLALSGCAGFKLPQNVVTDAIACTITVCN